MDNKIKDVFKTRGEISAEAILHGKVSAISTKVEDTLDLIESTDKALAELEDDFDTHVENQDADITRIDQTLGIWQTQMTTLDHKIGVVFAVVGTLAILESAFICWTLFR